MRRILTNFCLKRVVFYFLFTLFFFGNKDVLTAQSISGRVFDANTRKPLPFANVFISNTTIGSTTDIHGNYIISGSTPQNFELAASFVGYYTKSTRIDIIDSIHINVDFELSPKVNQLDEVELKARRDKKWERNLKRFEKVFLALPDDPFLKETKILNPWVLNFEQLKEGGRKYFLANAQEPILIENNSLGYQIEYHLQQFIEWRRGLHYSGLVKFQEMEGKRDIEEVRNSTFRGSLRYFIQLLIQNKIDTLEFEIYKVNPNLSASQRTNNFGYELGKSIKRIGRDSLYICELTENRIRIELPYRIEVHNLQMPWLSDYYEHINNSIFWLEAPRGFFIVDESGVLLDPRQLVRSGSVGRERMARFLPHDFEPSEDFGALVAAFDSTLVEKFKWNSLRERPHLSLNKAFYAPGEAIWFSSQMLYQNPMKADSLSKVLYVDLYGKDFDLVRTEKFEIKNGHVSGVLEVPDNLTAGDYVLRAYTNWSRNFGEDGFFYLPVPVLPSDRLAVAPSIEDWVDPEGEIELSIDAKFTSNEWNTRAELSVNIHEPDLDIRGGRINISILDADLNPAIGLNAPIAKSLDWLMESELGILFESPKYPIEFGISVKGYFSDRPKRPLSVPITIVKGELEDYGVVNSDSSGYFWATGLSFTDSAMISIAALNKRRKAIGNVRLVPNSIPEVRHFFPKLDYQTKLNPITDLRYRYADLMEGDYFELDEFTITNTEILNSASDNYGYGNPDRVIGQDQLELWPDLTLDRIISMNMPGGGMGRYNWGTETGSPLLIVDGARFFESPESGETVMEYLATILVSEVESIKVYTFSAPVFGMQGYAGVILVETKKGARGLDGSLVFDDSQFQKFTIRGFANVPEFPDFKKQDGVIYRQSAVYWNPQLEWDKDNTSIPISFEMSSQTKRLLIKVEGISYDNDPISKIFYMDVKN
ncbi:MAG: carboxypeptidase-like regulatory domain-containing protein [Cecembia sp.]